MRSVLGAILICILATSSGRADTLHVPSQFPTIAQGLAAAHSGDVVVVACGTYFEHDLQIPSGVALRSETGTADCVTIDAQGLDRVLGCEMAPAAITIEGITLANGYMPGVTFGEALRLEELDEDAYLDALEDEAERGGGGPTGVTGDLGGGAGAYCFASSVTFRDCVIRDCTTTASGAGIRGRYATVSLVRCRFENNDAQNQGGGLSLEHATSSSIVDCSFEANEARVGGGVIVLGSANVSVTRSFFAGNRAEAAQGGSGGALAGITSSVRIESSTLIANHAKIRGSAVYLGGASSVVFDRSIAAFGTGGTGGAFSRTGAGTGSALCADVFSNVGGDFTGPLSGQQGIAGNFSADPLICDFGQPELGIAAASPCLPANNSCGVLIGASGVLCEVSGVVVTTNPAGLQIIVDGQTFASPRFFDWVPGSVHTIGTLTPQDFGAQTRLEFDSWSDGGAIVHDVVHGDEATTYVASFDFSYFVTMTAGTGGIVSPPSGWWPSGAMVPITATATLPNYAFAAWTGIGDGSYTGPNNPGSITVQAPITQLANFSYTGPYTLSMASSPTQGGTTLPPSGPFPQGTVVQISASANPLFTFSHWSGNGAGSYDGPNNPATVTMNANITQTAVFDAQLFPLTMIAGPGGSVLPASGNRPALSTVQISAIPAPGHSFVGWTGTGSGSYTGTANPATITMLGPITQTATFQINTYHLTMNAGAGGSVSPPSGDYLYGTPVTITATPDSGFAFLAWTGSGGGSYSGSNNPVTITIGGNVTQTASFGGPSLSTITTLPPGLPVRADGITYISPAVFNWAIGSVHTVAVDSIIPNGPDVRHRYLSWSDNQPRQHSITVPPTPLLVFATFRHELRLQMIDLPEGHSIPATGWHTPGSVVYIRALGNPGFAFDSWTGTGNGSYTGETNAVTVTMHEPLTQTPSFRPFGFEFSISASASDPFVNTATPTGTLRELTLWMTCGEEGLSAFQARAIGSLNPIAFSPAPGVFNVGSATDLLLAISGCPIGTQTTFAIGTWSVLDMGGTLCLDDASSPHPFIAVECDEIEPSIVMNPRLVGFSSTGAPPCILDEHPCVGDGVAPLVDAESAGGVVALQNPPVIADALESARPNPFVESTEIHFSLAESRNVSLTIYDVSGRLVRTLLQENRVAGAHQIVWDGRSSGGELVPAGVYFVRLEAGSLSHTAKIVALRTR